MRNNNSDYSLQEIRTSVCNIQQKKDSHSYMISDPLGLSSFTNTSKIFEQKKQKQEKSKNPIKQIENRLQTLKSRLKKQNRRSFETENLELKKILTQKNHEIQKLKEMVQLLMESQKFNLDQQQVYALKIQFNQKKIQFIDYIEILSLRFTKEIDMLNKKIKVLENQLQRKNADHNPNHPLLKMSSFIQPLNHEESSISLNTNEAKKQFQQRVDRKRPKIFRKNQQKQFYKLIDHNGDFIQRDQVKLLLMNIDDFQTKLINLIERLQQFENPKINSSSYIKSRQNLIAQSNKTIQYAKSFLSLLRKIEVVKCDLVDLDSKANSLNESIANNINIQRFQHFK